MKTIVSRILVATGVTLVSVVSLADTFRWIGGGSDSYWGTDANWEKTEGGSDRTKPGNEDYAVFSQSEDLTVLLFEGSNVQGLRFEEGAGSVTLTLGDGWFNGRQLLIRRNMQGGTSTPGITNILNMSSNPFTVRSGLNATLNVLFSNAWGDFALTPGVIFDCPVSAVDSSNGWFLPQAALRTDNEEMNRTLFMRTANFYNTVTIGANHEVWVTGDAASMTVEGGDGAIVVNGSLAVYGENATVTCTSLSVGAAGSICGNGTINGAVTANAGAKLLFDAENVLTFTSAANLAGFTVDATGLVPGQAYLVAKGTTTLPSVSAAQAEQGWMTKAVDGNVVLVNSTADIVSDIVLSEDADWTDSVVSVADNVTIDLNGHNLSVAGITLGSGVAFVNNGAAKSRVYIGLNGGDKAWALGVAFPSSIMPVFCGAAIEIPNTYIPDGGIGFKDTAGVQPVYQKSCNNGLAFLGNANLKEPWKDWNFGQGKTCTVMVEGKSNVFAFDNDNGGTIPSAFTTTPFVGDGHLTIVSAASSGVTPTVGDKNTDDSLFTGTLALRNANSANKNRGFGIRFEDDNVTTKAFVNGTLALSCNDDADSQFDLLSGNYSTPPTYNLGNLVTEGEHQERVILRSHLNAVGLLATLKVGWNNEDGVFAGTITNMFGNDSYPIAIEKHGTGTWTLAGTVANGGTFTVAAGGVEFRGGLANVSSLSVASGASALFAGDMGSNPISLASGSTLKLDTSNTGDDVPVVNGNLDLTGVNVHVSRGTYVPSKTEPRELIRVTGFVTGFDRNGVTTDIAAPGWAFRLVSNEDGSKSIVHRRNPGFSVSLR